MINNKIHELDNITAYRFDGEINMKLHGIFADSVKFIERNQLCDVELWKKFVNQYRIQIDGEKGIWRCEYWGKMMRGACMILSYTKNDGIYRIIEASVRDMLTTQEENGRFSTYTLDTEFTSWDLWGRKYVMLGMQYFLEICRDQALAEQIVAAICRHADYIIEHIGPEKDGKKEIYKATRHWKGLNSCSILEPMVKLYRMTGEKRYLDFSEYIISTGFIDDGNLIELAYQNEIAPHEYPVVKAYEMMSCFEGLLQYYKITGIEKHKVALLNLGHRIIDGELSVIGCSGCTHELFDHTSVKQTQTDYKGIVQETCVTVTWMKFAEALLELSGDVAFADAIEQSFYNAYLGSFNTERALTSRYPQTPDVPQVLPFDSYSPLTADRRGRQVGGYNIFPDGTFYGCCACIAAAGSGIIPRFALLKNSAGIVINFYESGEITTHTPSSKQLRIITDTCYPVDGKVTLTLELENSESFALSLRIPAWCREAKLTVNGDATTVSAGYATVTREWCNGDTVVLDMPMPVERILPPAGADNEDVFAAYRRGPVVLAADARLADPRSVIEIACDENGLADGKLVDCLEINDSFVCVELAKTDGEKVRLINYSSAGKTWEKDSECAAWLYKKAISDVAES
ncbi:MAG: glycoside hydrolase family 127 protein [Clostridia bacterium]|nr:glycoside hydrolase family 127 protein [Clostridia bacterium]